MQISFSVEEALVEKLDAAAKLMNISRSSLIAMLLKWAVESSPLIKEGKLREGVAPSAVPPTTTEIMEIVRDLQKEVETLKKLGVKVTFVSENDEAKMRKLAKSGREAS